MASKVREFRTFSSHQGMASMFSGHPELDFLAPNDADPAVPSMPLNLPIGLGMGVQRDSFASASFHNVRPRVTRHGEARSFPGTGLSSPVDRQAASQPSSPILAFDNLIRNLRWRGDGRCCKILAGAQGIDTARASRAIPHLWYLSALSPGHLSQADLSGFRACITLSAVSDWPASTSCVDELISACKELAGNGSAAAVVSVVLSPVPGGPDRDAKSTGALQQAILAAGADAVLFSCPTQPVTFRQLQSAVQGTENWHEKTAEAIESAQTKMVRAQEQRWQRHYQIALRKIVWKAPQTVFPHIPQEDAGLEEREGGVGDYTFSRVVGSGTFGRVHLAKHPRLGDVAVKSIKKASIKSIFDLAKVERELSILMGVLDHPNVLRIISCLHGANNLYIVMEFLGEYTLHTYLHLRQTGSARNVVMLPLQEVQGIFGDMLKAIWHCHLHHVCHRDIKFRNAMLDANSRVTMVDFGLSVHVAPGQELHDSCGTVPFSAPEVMTCSLSKGYDGTAADVWSLVVCVVELLCGLGTVESMIGLSPEDESNVDHIANQCLLLSTEYVHQLVLSYAGKDVQGMHRSDLVKVMRGVFREHARSRMTVADIGALDAFSAKAGPLPKANKRREADEDGSSGRSVGRSKSEFKSDTHSECAASTFEVTLENDIAIRPQQPLLERIGGAQTVEKVVSTVYDWLAFRPEFGRFFLACPLKMGRIRAGITSFLITLLDNPESCDLEMMKKLHYELNISDYLFTEFADALLESFRTWGSRGDSTMPDIQKCLETLRVPITAGHRARLAVAQTDRSPEEIIFLVGSLPSTAGDFARALSDLLTQDARLEGKHFDEMSTGRLENFAHLVWQGALDDAMKAVFSGERPLFQEDAGATTMFCESVRQVLRELGLDDHDASDMQLLMEHAGELVLDRARNSSLAQPLSMGYDIVWFKKILLGLCKADPFLQYFAENPKMEHCVESIFRLLSGSGDTDNASSSKLRSAHQHIYLNDARYTAFMANIDKVLRAMFPWPVHPAAVASGYIRSLEGLRTEVLCGSTLRSSRMQAREAALNSTTEQVSKSRRTRIMETMQRCAGALFDTLTSDSRVSVFFRNSDPACKDRKANYLGCILAGNPPSAVTPASGYTSALSSLKQQHRLFRITHYHFDVFLEHVRKALSPSDPEAADLAPAILDSAREHVVSSQPTRCPFSGSTSNGSCPFRQWSGSATLLEQIGGKDGIDKILTDMEREAASSTMLLPFLTSEAKLPCHAAILDRLCTEAAGDAPTQVNKESLQKSHGHLEIFPDHLDQLLTCFHRSMVAHILPPVMAEKLTNGFSALASAISPTVSPLKRETSELHWGGLKVLFDELGDEEGLGKLIEAWYHYISIEPSINVFFSGTRSEVMMFQTQFWSQVLREGLHSDGRRQLQMIKIHQHLKIQHMHFDAFVRCMMQACEQLSLSKESCNSMRVAVECFRQQIVTDFT
eukprot:TRINITY_DN26903_c0_g1_i1.p1 TRINITY_DN26903_c0_g1~~TRINITY_DN26903_c0_g1_i1.p1  ORF type:complete len:1482 (-),score=245.16 TRINITY_DN26903_c0_g1_i1:147-4532(-)